MKKLDSNCLALMTDLFVSFLYDVGNGILDIWKDMGSRSCIDQM